MALDKSIYDASTINWDKIKELAQRVAKETKAPCFEHEVEVEETKERTVSCGFLNLQKRIETYQKRTKQHIVTDYWLLECRHWYKKERFMNHSEASYEDYFYCLRINGELFAYNESWEEANSGTGYYNPCGIGNISGSMNSMSDRDVMLFDFKPRCDHFENLDLRTVGGSLVDTNREPSDELLYQTKGEGLIELLNKLLERTT